MLLLDEDIIKRGVPDIEHLSIVFISATALEISFAKRAKSIGHGITAKTITRGAPGASAIITRAAIDIHIFDVRPHRAKLYSPIPILVSNGLGCGLGQIASGDVLWPVNPWALISCFIVTGAIAHKKVVIVICIHEPSGREAAMVR
jgi:hypothetical protein